MDEELDLCEGPLDVLVGPELLCTASIGLFSFRG